MRQTLPGSIGAAKDRVSGSAQYEQPHLALFILMKPELLGRRRDTEVYGGTQSVWAKINLEYIGFGCPQSLLACCPLLTDLGTALVFEILVCVLSWCDPMPGAPEWDGVFSLSWLRWTCLSLLGIFSRRWMHLTLSLSQSRCMLIMLNNHNPNWV